MKEWPGTTETARAYTRRMLGRGAKAQRIHKALGQNFLIDDTVVEQIVAAVPETESLLLEVGAGLGVLTRRLARRSAELWAVELDAAKAELLSTELLGSGAHIWQADALTIDLATLWEGRRGWLVGNLPYYITNPLLMHFLQQADALQGMTVMLQKEVAARVIASPGSRTYGVLSIAVQVAAEAQALFDVPPQAFWPAPKVTSTVLNLRMRPHPEVSIALPLFFRTVKAAFASRRKTIANSLSGTLGLEKQAVLTSLARIGIDEQRRAETLSIAEFQALTLELAPVLGAATGIK